jgi:hypothetical protein
MLTDTITLEVQGRTFERVHGHWGERLGPSVKVALDSRESSLLDEIQRLREQLAKLLEAAKLALEWRLVDDESWSVDVAAIKKAIEQAEASG